jgi:ATP phosphoribosyltransferase
MSLLPQSSGEYAAETPTSRRIESMSSVLKLGIPAGNLQEPTATLFRRAGYKITLSSRSYYPVIDDDEIECLLIRAQEIAKYVENGVLDAGVTGRDWVIENNADVHEVAELAFSEASRPARWVLCVPEDSPVQTVSDLEGKRIATEAVGLTTGYLKKHGVEARVEFSWGATEVKPPKLADATVQMRASVFTTNVASLRRNPFKQKDLATLSHQCDQSTRDSPVYRADLSFQGRRLGCENSISSDFIERCSRTFKRVSNYCP